MEKKQISRKHVGKSVSKEQEAQIKELQDKMGKDQGRTVVYLEAKHEYFEAKEKEGSFKGSEEDAAPKLKPGESVKTAELNFEGAKKLEPVKKKRMTIEETKLGVTMVLSKEDCEKLGLNLNGPTKDAIIAVRNRLGLPAKKNRNF